ncbi:MAG: protein NO VEIN domain-containing protein, partial [Janthinobacterium lividum]
MEQKAVEITWAHYKGLGYDLETVERDKVGWDLTATNGRVKLKLEVKGLSGPMVAAELTANEYKHLQLDKPNYRVCVVTSALTSPQFHVFSYSQTTNRWESAEGVPLSFEEVTSARVFT